MTRKMTLRSAISTLGRDEENRRLKAEVRRLRAALRKAIPFIGYSQHVPEIVEECEQALRRERAR